MNRKELDTLWFQAMRTSIEKGDDFVRYDFAALVAAAEREACAKVADKYSPGLGPIIAAAIRTRGEKA